MRDERIQTQAFIQSDIDVNFRQIHPVGRSERDYEWLA